MLLADFTGNDPLILAPCVHPEPMVQTCLPRRLAPRSLQPLPPCNILHPWQPGR